MSKFYKRTSCAGAISIIIFSTVININDMEHIDPYNYPIIQQTQVQSAAGTTMVNTISPITYKIIEHGNF